MKGINFLWLLSWEISMEQEHDPLSNPRVCPHCLRSDMTVHIGALIWVVLVVVGFLEHIDLLLSFHQSCGVCV
jgi:hypothetical protein